MRNDRIQGILFDAKETIMLGRRSKPRKAIDVIKRARDRRRVVVQQRKFSAPVVSIPYMNLSDTPSDARTLTQLLDEIHSR